MTNPTPERIAEVAATLAGILAWRNAEAKAAEARGEKLFMGKPEGWYEDLHWYCPNGHVSGRYLSGHSDRCLACGEQVLMGPALTEREFAPILAHLKETADDRA